MAKSDFQRLLDLKEEAANIRLKLMLAESISGEPLSGLDELLGTLNEEIRKAAEAEATRETKQAILEAKELQTSPEERDNQDDDDDDRDFIDILKDWMKSVPRHPQQPEGSDNPGNEESSEGEDGGDGKCCCCCCGDGGAGAVAIAGAIAIALGGGGGGGGGGGASKKDDKKKLPDASCIYVKGKTAIWGWNRYTGKWVKHDFGEPVISVKSGKSGFLALSKSGAIVFDCALGKFLAPLDAGQDVADGKIS